MPVESNDRFKIKDLTVDIGARQVSRDGVPLKLSGLTFDLFVALADASPSMLNHDDLASQVWSGRPVSQETISQRVKLLRDALSDDARAPRYIELVRGQGYRLAAPVEPMLPTSDTTQSPRWFMVVAAVLVAGLLASAVVWRNVAVSSPTGSVAVLPFSDLSPAGDQQYLADGIATELINQLADLEGLEVASRTASFAYREPAQDVGEVGTQLGVAAILEGSVRRSATEVSVSVRLIDVDSGFDVWSETINRKPDDLMRLQQEIAQSVAAALGVELGVAGVNDFAGAGTDSAAAYDAYLRGDYERAIQLDPEYAAAWGRRGVDIASTMWANPPDEAPQIIQRAARYTERALELDPTSAQAHSDYATRIYVTLQWHEAQRAFQRALDIKRAPYVLYNFGNMLGRTGRLTAAGEVYEEAAVRERMPVRNSRHVINLDMALGRIESAHARIDQLPVDLHKHLVRWRVALNAADHEGLRAAFEAAPQRGPMHSEFIRPLLKLMDDRESALVFLGDLARNESIMWPSKYEVTALMMAYYGDAEAAWDVLQRDVRYTTIRYGTLWYPVLKDVRQLPQFKQFVFDSRLVDYWRTYGWADRCWPVGETDFVCE